MPQSGGLGADGQEWLKGIRLAAQEVNAAGGPLPGREIELVVLDSRTDPMAAIEQARRLVEPSDPSQRVAAIIGDAGSGGTLAIYTNVTRDNRVPQVSCCATSPRLTEASAASALEDRFFFRTSPSDALQGLVVARIGRDEGCTRMAILHIDDAYGTPFADAIEQEFTRGMGTITAKVPFMEERTSYTAEVMTVAASMPDCVALIAYPPSAGRILRDYARVPMRPTVTWIGTDGLRSETFIMEATPAQLATLRFVGAAPITQPMEPPFEAFARRYRAVFGGAPAPFVSNNYDAAALLFLGIARAGSTDGRAIMESVRALASEGGRIVRAGDLAEGIYRLREGQQVNYDGASGAVDVDEFGDVRSDYEVWRVSMDGTSIIQDRIILARDLR